MIATDLPPLIRGCVDGEVSPITAGEARARAAMTQGAVRRVRAQRWSRPDVAATGLAAAEEGRMLHRFLATAVPMRRTGSPGRARSAGPPRRAGVPAGGPGPPASAGAPGVRGAFGG